ncbi:hypothetical protein HWV62_31857 [Athelia sp. TMB]|nr:hypothetical protein HWV62_31857 [Athelia sp. TMB]
MPPTTTSRRVPGRYPPPGDSEIADRIRTRRGARGLTPLDGTLLHVPPIADGWNKLLGAVRTGGKLGGDIRELMILRVAALNGAAFEWIQHEPVGRAEGLSTAQLYAIRDTSLSAPTPSVLTSLQAAALAFADASTKHVKVPDDVFDALKSELESSESGSSDDLVVEAVAVVATYNMVSRFLVSLDVAGKSDEAVPWPVDRVEHTIQIPDTSPPLSLHATTLTPPTPSGKWLVLVNSLLTDQHLWNKVTPALTRAGYTILLYDQRGHGQSTPPPEGAAWTIGDLADDIALLIRSICPERAVHAVVGVSLGGASALAFGARHPALARKIVACDTQARTPPANVGAWDQRIALAREAGMEQLAEATVGRWFPSGEALELGWVRAMVAATPLAGFVSCVRALQAYDLLVVSPSAPALFDGRLPVLLLAGGRDGALPATLGKLAEEWNAASGGAGGGRVEYVEIEGAGHLPMVDRPEQWVDAVLRFLDEDA